jgi:hypothetical protein
MCQNTTQTPVSNKRLCCVCDKPLYGRSDKVFCDYHCKNKYHADIRKHTKSAASVSNAILYKNYQILCILLGDNCSKYSISKKELQKRGFVFEAVSSFTLTPYGVKHEIFELSWYYSKNNQIIVLHDKNQAKISPFMYKRWQRTLQFQQTEPVVVLDKMGSKVQLNCSS